MPLIISRNASLLKGRVLLDRNVFQKEQMMGLLFVLCERKQEFGVFIWLVDPFPLIQQFIISATCFASAFEFQSRSEVYEKRRV